LPATSVCEKTLVIHKTALKVKIKVIKNKNKKRVDLQEKQEE
jgi:hypothetical protein